MNREQSMASAQRSLLQDQVGQLGEELVARTRVVREGLKKRRKLLSLIAAMVFFGGLWLSAASIELSWRDVSWRPLLFVFFILAPATLATAALSVQLAARLVGTRLTFRDAFTVGAVSRVAEILPIPGGAVIRGGALMRAGAGIGAASWAVTVTSALTLFMSFAVGALPLILTGLLFGFALCLAGLVGAVACAWLIARRGGVRLAAATVGLRFAIFGLSAIRISLAFAVIGVAATPVESLLFVVCASLGGAVAIAPGGLGVSESIAAGLAAFSPVSPGAAFLAIALNRLIGMAASGIAAFTLTAMNRKSRSVH